MNPIMFHPITLEAWTSDYKINLLFQTKLKNYLQNYFLCFRSEPQRKLFETFIHALLSLLECKFIEPIVLHFFIKKYVRPMRQFFSWSPFKEQLILETYQKLLSDQIGNSTGILSVDDTVILYNT
ncbi:hypothetical protein AALB81_01880 [Lachnospiraceae bacterium 48-33]